jgi:hypothetical protein
MMPVLFPISSASHSTVLLSTLTGVGPWPWSVPTGIMTVSDFSKASCASIQDISHRRYFDMMYPDHHSSLPVLTFFRVRIKEIISAIEMM